MIIHCDSCGRELGTYLYGKGGIQEKAKIFNNNYAYRLPDIVCNQCFDEGFHYTHPKYPQKVFNSTYLEYLKRKGKL